MAAKEAIEWKIVFLNLKENQRGRFLKITEDVGGRRDTLMLPAEAFKDFVEALQRLVEFEAKLADDTDPMHSGGENSRNGCGG